VLKARHEQHGRKWHTGKDKEDRAWYLAANAIWRANKDGTLPPEIRTAVEELSGWAWAKSVAGSIDDLIAAIGTTNQLPEKREIRSACGWQLGHLALIYQKHASDAEIMAAFDRLADVLCEDDRLWLHSESRLEELRALRKSGSTAYSNGLLSEYRALTNTNRNTYDKAAHVEWRAALTLEEKVTHMKNRALRVQCAEDLGIIATYVTQQQFDEWLLLLTPERERDIYMDAPGLWYAVRGNPELRGEPVFSKGKGKGEKS